MCVFNVITLIHRWFQLLASGLLQVLTSDDTLDLEYVWVFCIMQYFLRCLWDFTVPGNQ